MDTEKQTHLNSSSSNVELSDDTKQLIGLLGFSMLAAMTRLAKDGDQAPNIDYHVEHARMAGRAFDEYLQLEDFAEMNGFDLKEVAGAYAGIYDELDQRTRPSNWWERSVKSYVTMGIFTDALSELNDRHQLFSAEQWTGDTKHGQWVREHLADITAADPQLAARLSLWARRVAGEAFGLLRATLFSYPELARDPDTVDAIVELATKRHAERLREVNLLP